MFRFTIRDVLWLTVVVALSVAWWISRNELKTASVWKNRAGALEGVLAEDDWIVEWDKDVVRLHTKNGSDTITGKFQDDVSGQVLTVDWESKR